LDTGLFATDTPGMSSEPNLQMLVLERIDPAHNMSRYYVLSISPSLFGDIALTREWGRIGRAGQRRIELHSEPLQAREALAAWLRRKAARGYTVAYGT
jgi:predicted DNA-binding WGR domain protein